MKSQFAKRTLALLLAMVMSLGTLPTAVFASEAAPGSESSTEESQTSENETDENETDENETDENETDENEEKKTDEANKEEPAAPGAGIAGASAFAGTFAAVADNTITFTNADTDSGALTLAKVTAAIEEIVEFDATDGRYTVTIAGDVTSIGEGAFQGRPWVAAVEFAASENKITIGMSAFSGCENLVSVAFNRPADIGDTAFENAALMKNPPSNGFNELEYYENASSLAAVDFGGKEMKIGAGAFRGALKLETVDLSTATAIGATAFDYCHGLRTVTLPSSLTKIEDATFRNCESLTGLDLSKVTIVGNAAFDGCSSLTLTEGSLSLATSIGECAFRGAAITALNLSKVTTVGNSAFDGCSSLTLTEGSLSVATSIEPAAFRRTAITVLDLPKATSIGDEAFAYCTSLTDVTLLSGTLTASAGQVQSSFLGCANITSLTITGSGTIAAGAFNADRDFKGLKTLVIGDGVTITGDNDFARQPLVNVTLPAGEFTADAGKVQSAFAGCTEITSLTITGSGTIAAGAFNTGRDFKGLKTLVIGDGVTAIGNDAFANQPLENVTITTNIASGSGLTQALLGSIFAKTGGITPITTLTITGTGQIGSAAFSDFHSTLTSLTIAEGVTEIGESAFEGCGKITAVAIPSTVTTIGKRAFIGTGLTSITVPATVTSVGEEAFAGCPSLKSATVNTAAVSKKMFDNCTALSSLSLSGTTTIGEDAFATCTSLTSVTIPSTVTAIGGGAFWNTGIKSIVIPANVASIGGLAFANCSALTSITMRRMSAPTIVAINKGGTNYTNLVSSGVVGTLPINIPDSASGYDEGLWAAYNTNSVAALSNLQKVNEDKSAVILTSILNQNVDKDNITTKLTLPTSGAVHGSGISWLSSNPDRISTDGTVNRREGVDDVVVLTATFTQGSGGSTATATLSFTLKVKGTEVTPVANTPVSGVTLNPSTTLTIEAGASASFSAEVSPTNATDRRVTWSNSNPTAAVIQSDGATVKVVGVSAGTTVITAMAGDKVASRVVTVTSKPTPVVTEAVKEQVTSTVTTAVSNIASATPQEAQAQVNNAVTSIVAQVAGNNASEAGAAIQNNTAIINSISNLETAYKEAANIEVAPPAVAPDLSSKGISASSISIVGAALNADPGQTVALDIKTPDVPVAVPDEFEQTIQLKIDITGVQNSANLALPITITLPVPAGFSASNMVIIHHHSGGEISYITPTPGRGNTMSFTVSGFSTFVLANTSVYVQKPNDILSTGDRGSSTSSTSSFLPLNTPVNITTAAANSAAQAAVAAAKASGTATAAARILNPGEITLETLQTMAKTAGMPLRLYADSTSSNGRSVEVRISLYPSGATKNLNLSASTSSAVAKAWENLFEKWFNNNVTIVSCGQQGDFGQSVEIAAKVDPALDTGSLVFYSYNTATNTYARMSNTTYLIDKNGYIHFNTFLAGNIVITDKPLTIR